MPTNTTLPLPYADDSRGLMTCLSRLARPVFLDSGLERGTHRRFDILAAEPVAWIAVTSDSCSSSDPDIEVSRNSLFKVIRKLRDKYISKPEPDDALPADLPFHGGLLGYLGYPNLQGRDELLIGDAYVGAYQWAVIVDHEQRRTTLVAQAGFPAGKLQSILHRLRTADLDASLLSGFRLLTDFQCQLSRSQYDLAFAEIKTYIRNGDCYQVNLTQQVSAACTGNPFAAYLQLRDCMPAPFSAFIGWPGGALLSFSPERFLQLANRVVLTQPIKGTRPRAADPFQDRQLALELAASEKDRAENLMIVDLLRNDLGRVCDTGSVQANQLFALNSFSNVHHLVSSIGARLAAKHDALDLLEACFPGGSITGAPKLRAMAIIQELETTPRRVYCGTTFYLGANGNMDSNITIRSLLWEAGHLHCWAGGGIVQDSEADAEYAECFDKIAKIINSLAS